MLTELNHPLISVIVEGYNESRDLGTADETMAALRQQNFPLQQVEVILVGSPEQTQEWQQTYANQVDFFAVKMLATKGEHYYELKNTGAAVALGKIVAFTDSDVRPKATWLSAIAETIQAGADVVAGPSLFRPIHNRLSPDSPLMRVFASITWGWIVGKHKQGAFLRAVGFMDHNVAMRTEVFRDHRYRTEFGRVIASPLLYRALANAGLTIAIQPQQQAAHHFTFKYWIFNLHFRYGYEVFHLRRLDHDYPNQWIAQTRLLEPLVTLIWHLLLDIPKWFRFSSLLDTNLAYRVAMLPVVIVLSTIAHTAEMLGMYSTLIAPKAMEQWSRTV
jgi:glycosyltransferase involved in cell wall biosynthesis